MSDNKIYTYQDMLDFLLTKTPEELAQPALVSAENFGAQIVGEWTAEEDHINPSGEGAEPRSAYLPGGDFYEPSEDYSDEPVVIKKGSFCFMLNY